MNVILETSTHKIESDGRELNSDEIEIHWRDSELLRTDSMLQVDRPNYQAILTYRQELRDYPESANFLTKRPKL